MVKRALLIGSQTGGLAGVHTDVDNAAALLTGLVFVTTSRVGRYPAQGVMTAHDFSFSYEVIPLDWHSHTCAAMREECDEHE